MSKRKNSRYSEDFSRDKEELREISRFSRVGRNKKWKFDKNNLDRYMSGDDEEEFYGRR